MDISGISSSSGLHAVSGASFGAPPQQKMSNLFDSIDTSGSGSITQSQFEQAFQTKILQPFSRIRERMRSSPHSIPPVPAAYQSKSSSRPCPS
jgi:hypothetical protein